MTSYRKLTKYYMEHRPRHGMDKVRSVLRSEWAAGPWNEECDDFYFTHRRVHCLGWRNHLGVWCGYVGVWRGHPWFGKDYSDVEMDAPGGLTYSGKLYPKPGHPWFLGFDCGHSYDYTPGLATVFEAAGASCGPPESAYKTMPYVIYCLCEMAGEVRSAA